MSMGKVSAVKTIQKMFIKKNICIYFFSLGAIDNYDWHLTAKCALNSFPVICAVLGEIPYSIKQ